MVYAGKQVHCPCKGSVCYDLFIQKQASKQKNKEILAVATSLGKKKCSPTQVHAGPIYQPQVPIVLPNLQTKQN